MRSVRAAREDAQRAEDGGAVGRMAGVRLHDGETSVDASTVARLIAEQVPDLAGLPVRPLEGLGTAHHVFRVGGAAVARLPRTAGAAEDLPREAVVLARVAGRLPVATPEVLLAGRPGAGYPHPWVLQRWLPGDQVLPTTDAPLDAARGEAMARVVAALHAIDPDGLPAAGRRPLQELDAATREAIGATVELDRAALLAAWERALEAPPWDGVRTVIHADLLPGNLLESDGRISAVIDWGVAGAGDPAHDLVTAWATLRAAGRRRLKSLLDPDDGTWARARGIALHQALLSIPYYRAAHPRFSAMNAATAAEVLADRD